MGQYKAIKIKATDVTPVGLLAYYPNFYSPYSATFGVVCAPRKQNILIKGKGIDQAFWHYCNSCPAYNFSECPGGYQQLIKVGGCVYKYNLEEEEQIVQKQLNTHMLSFAENNSMRCVHEIKLDPTKGDLVFDMMQTFPYALGNVYSSGRICTGNISTGKSRDFEKYYYEIWTAVHTGHIWPFEARLSKMQLRQLIEEFSGDWCIERLETNPKKFVSSDPQFRKWISFNPPSGPNRYYERAWWISPVGTGEYFYYYFPMPDVYINYHLEIVSGSDEERRRLNAFFGVDFENPTSCYRVVVNNHGHVLYCQDAATRTTNPADPMRLHSFSELKALLEGLEFDKNHIEKSYTLADIH